MAARLNRLDTERVVTRIQAVKILDRIQKFALGESQRCAVGASDGVSGAPSGETKLVKVEMTDAQLRAACFLLERVLARAEAPKQVHVQMSLSDLIRQSLEQGRLDPPGAVLPPAALGAAMSQITHDSDADRDDDRDVNR